MLKQDQAEQALESFLPRAGQDYAATRNYDYGPGQRDNVSMLSPYVRMRRLPEWEICRRVIERYPDGEASKFIDEVCWRTYWKGWLEMRPSVWQAYLINLHTVRNSYESDSLYERAVSAETGIECLDTWTAELRETGYLHNHARMWYASIWIHTLKIPWVLGADFFLQNLLDGDAASNTLSWRWVAGLHTKGKSYLAKAENIRKCTAARFDPDTDLAKEPIDLSEKAESPSPEPLSALPALPDEGRVGLLLHDEDLSAVYWLQKQIDCRAIAGVLPEDAYASHRISEHVTQFRKDGLMDALGDQGTYHGSVDAILNWSELANLDHIVMAQPSVGLWDDVLPELKNALRSRGVRLSTARHWWDELLFPEARAGFFRFKKSIPSALERLEISQPKM